MPRVIALGLFDEADKELSSHMRVDRDPNGVEYYPSAGGARLRADLRNLRCDGVVHWLIYSADSAEPKFETIDLNVALKRFDQAA